MPCWEGAVGAGPWSGGRFMHNLRQYLRSAHGGPYRAARGGRLGAKFRPGAAARVHTRAACIPATAAPICTAGRDSRAPVRRVVQVETARRRAAAATREPLDRGERHRGTHATAVAGGRRARRAPHTRIRAHATPATCPRMGTSGAHLQRRGAKLSAPAAPWAAARRGPARFRAPSRRLRTSPACARRLADRGCADLPTCAPSACRSGEQPPRESARRPWAVFRDGAPDRQPAASAAEQDPQARAAVGRVQHLLLQGIVPGAPNRMPKQGAAASRRAVKGI